MILLLGSTGYIGHAFQAALQQRGEKYTTLTRAEADHTQFASLLAWLKTHRPSFVINAAGYTGRPNVDACETTRAETLNGNLLWPLTLAHACSQLSIPWGHVSSGCIFNGAHLHTENGWAVQPDLTHPSVRQLLQSSPEKFRGFTEEDVPNFTFQQPRCSFYSGTKALAEDSISQMGGSYQWRLRIPFDESDHPKNYLSKLLRYERTYYNVNSLSHRMDFANACLDSWKQKIPFGIYNVTNPGFVTTTEVIAQIQGILRPEKIFRYWESDQEFYTHAATAPRSNCILDTGKLLAAGVQIRSVNEAVEASLRQWRAAPDF